MKPDRSAGPDPDIAAIVPGPQERLYDLPEEIVPTADPTESEEETP